MKAKIKLNIADIIIEMQSRFKMEVVTDKKMKERASERFKNFFYNGGRKPDIKIKVELADKLPDAQKAKRVFITHHYQSGQENWRLLKKGNFYIYKCPMKDKRQLILLDEKFSHALAYLLPRKERSGVWSVLDLIYDFLQILLINYLALRKSGILVHSTGVKDTDGRGFLFVGKSGSGKSTSARIWHEHSRAMVLNDDRIILRRRNGKFFIYGSPWHGTFRDYLASSRGSAPLDKLFFICHGRRNKIERVQPKMALSILYAQLFPTFWDKQSLDNIVSFSMDAVQSTPCYRLGFARNKEIIDFVRRTL
jgi:hypothetical protein